MNAIQARLRHNPAGDLLYWIRSPLLDLGKKPDILSLLVGLSGRMKTAVEGNNSCDKRSY